MICYCRLLLVAAAASASSVHPASAAGLLLISLILDGVDGALARRLGQVSSFGAFLDVAVDLASRGLLWSWALPGGGGAAVLLLEALTFTCTQAASGAAWKSELASGAAPRWVRAVMSNGFKTPAGCLAVAGLMGCPLWLWGRRVLPEGPWSSPLLGAVLVAGRLLAAAVESWVVCRHLGALLQADVAAAADAAAANAAAAKVPGATAGTGTGGMAAAAGAGLGAAGQVAAEAPAGPAADDGGGASGQAGRG